MLSGSVAWLIGSAIAAGATAWFRYGRREEAVPGRTGPAILFALALFLVLAGFVLPSLRTSPPPPTPTVAVLDISASMDLPGFPGGQSRLDSGRAAVQRLSPDRIVTFSTSVSDPIAPTGLDSVIGVAGRTGSRLAPALRVARAAGADSVVVFTDGELEDREDARREAERLGLRVREYRTASPVSRTTVRGVSAPGRVSAGDTISFAIEISTQVSSGTSTDADSVTVTVEGPQGTKATVRVGRPSPGRSRIAEVRLPAPEVSEVSAWRQFGVSLDPGADPLAAGQTRSVWLEISRGRTGVVLVSVDPDWEPRQLLPVLERASAGGARAFLRIRPDHWVKAGTVPEPVAESRVRAEASDSDLLVVQAGLSDLPPWLRDLAGRHSRVLFLARGSGNLPGSEIAVGALLDGDWFAALPPPSNPVAGALSGLDAEGLPPVAALRAVQGAGVWTIFRLRRDRRGDEMPAAVGFAAGGARRVLVLAEGTWRWSARTGSARSVYRGLYAGIAGWLLGDFRSVPVTLAADPAAGRGSIEWSVAPGVQDLVVVVRDSTGNTVWTDSIAVPAERVAGPYLSAGELEFEARGRIEESGFVVGRPFTVAGPTAELSGRDVGASLTSRAELSSFRRPVGRPTAPPLWPYVLAAGLLCAEWIWRHRLGLR